MEKILVTGSDGRFGKILKKINSKKKLIFTNKKNLNILSKSSIVKNLSKHKPKYILHLAGLSRPMNVHKKNISKSIDLNIIGTCNLVKEAEKKILNLFIYLQTMFIPVQKVIIKKPMHLNPGIIILGRNWVANARFKCTINL